MNLRQHMKSLWRAIRTRPAARGTPRRRSVAPTVQTLEERLEMTVFPGVGTPIRTPVNEARIYPFDAVVRLEIYFPKSKSPVLGSGALISAPRQKGSNHVLTAAHLFYRPDLGGYATKAIVIPGQNGPNFKPFGTAAKTLTQFYPGWFAHNTFNYDDDLAVIKINRTFPNSFGYDAASNVSNPLLNTAGYPEDLSTNGTAMYQDNGYASVTANGQQLSFTSIDTYIGQSGSPLWLYFPLTNQSIIIGVISHESSTANYGTLITPAKYAWILQQVKK
jgi:V8-like Glu-specific endopeptidase